MVKNRVCNDCTRCPKERVQVVRVRPRRTRGRTRHFVCLPRPLRRHGTDGSQLDEAAVLLHDLTGSHMTSRETVLVFVRQTIREQLLLSDDFCCAVQILDAVEICTKTQEIRKQDVAGIAAVWVSVKLRDCVPRKYLRVSWPLLLHFVSTTRTRHRVLERRVRHL